MRDSDSGSAAIELTSTGIQRERRNVVALEGWCLDDLMNFERMQRCENRRRQPDEVRATIPFHALYNAPAACWLIRIVKKTIADGTSDLARISDEDAGPGCDSVLGRLHEISGSGRVCQNGRRKTEERRMVNRIRIRPLLAACGLFLFGNGFGADRFQRIRSRSASVSKAARVIRIPCEYLLLRMEGEDVKWPSWT